MEGSAPLMQLARRAQARFAVPEPAGSWLWEHVRRTVTTAGLLAACGELDPPAERAAVGAAAMYRDAGWAVQVREGQIPPEQVLSRPTQDLQLELAAEALLDDAEGLLDTVTLDRAAEAIRQSGRREAALPEAIVLSDACNLQAVGPLELLRQFRQYQRQGQSLGRLIETWRRKQQYRYWDAWIAECLRLEISRRLARERVAAFEQVLDALERQVAAADLAALLRAAGIDAPQPLALE